MKTNIMVGMLVLFGALPMTQAYFDIYFAEDVSPFVAGAVNDVPRIKIPNSQAMRAQFRSRLTGTTEESFESFARYSSPTNLNFGTNTARLSGTREIERVTVPDNTDNGVYPITGINYLLLPVDQVGFFAVDFSAPQAAFGFFGTDFGEFGQMQLGFIGTNGARTDILLPVTKPQESGGCFFFGAISLGAPFTRIEFTRIGTADGFGFDDMSAATPAQVLPAQPAALEVALRPALRISGTVGAHYAIQFATSLPATNWTTITNVLLPTSPYLYADVTATNQARYYRAVLLE